MLNEGVGPVLGRLDDFDGRSLKVIARQVTGIDCTKPEEGYEDLRASGGGFMQVRIRTHVVEYIQAECVCGQTRGQAPAACLSSSVNCVVLRCVFERESCMLLFVECVR